MNQRSLAIITARGGSKRIPRKNIKDFCGKPIMAYSIEAALEAGCFDTVMVSTDDEEIAQIAKNMVRKCLFAERAHSGRFCNNSGCTDGGVRGIRKAWREVRPCGVHLSNSTVCNSTEVKGRNVTVTGEAGDDADAYCGIFVSTAARCCKKGEFLEFCYPQYRNSRSQDLETMYHDCGQFYCYDVEKYRSVRGQIDTGIIPYIVSELEVQDIDNETDWKLAEMKYRMMKGE